MKNFPRRLDKLTRALNVTSQPMPIDVYMRQVGEDESTGTTFYENGRVHEIRFNAQHPLILPPGGPHKLIRGEYIDV